MVRVSRIHVPDGEISVRQYDDPDRCMVSYTLDKQGNHSVISVVHGNILGKPAEQMLLPESVPFPLSVKEYCINDSKLSDAKTTTATYDGYGRTVSSINPANKVVTEHYDALGRVSEMINPVGDKIHNVYNSLGQPIQKWLIPVRDHHSYLLSSAQYNAKGELLWAGWGRWKTYRVYIHF